MMKRVTGVYVRINVLLTPHRDVRCLEQEITEFVSARRYVNARIVCSNDQITAAHPASTRTGTDFDAGVFDS